MNGRKLLARYLEKSEESQRAFERRVDLSAGQVSGYLSGNRRPGVDVAAAIERATAGDVPAVSWAEADDRPPPARRLRPEPA